MQGRCLGFCIQRYWLAIIFASFFFSQLCLQESNEVHLSALGVAMASLVTVAEILKARQLVVVKRLSTVLELFEDRSPKPKVGCFGVCVEGWVCCEACYAH